MSIVIDCEKAGLTTESAIIVERTSASMMAMFNEQNLIFSQMPFSGSICFVSSAELRKYYILVLLYRSEHIIDNSLYVRSS